MTSGLSCSSPIARRASERRRVEERTRAARECALQLPFTLTSAHARAVRDSVPFWFHTFALCAREAVFTPGVAHDAHRRLAAIPGRLDGASVLDVGAFDGFFAFLAEHRGARRVLAIDSEQYRGWVRRRWRIRLSGAAGFHAIAKARDSAVDYRRMDAAAASALQESFDWILCLGLLHRVPNPLRVLRALGDVLGPDGRILIETYAVLPSVPPRADTGVRRCFTPADLDALLTSAGLSGEVLDLRVIHGHPRLLVQASAEV